MDEKELEEILKSYRENLAEIKENRMKEAVKYAQMTEEEKLEQLEDEYDEIVEDAENNGVTFGVFPVLNDKKDKKD